MRNNKLFILTGAMGAGKSTVLAEIPKIGIECVQEPARQILKEQRSIGGSGVPERDPGIFSELMLSRSMNQYIERETTEKTIILDRGLPDMLGYAELFKLNPTIFANAAQLYRYNPMVFFFEGWEDIYTTDDERRIDFTGANEFGNILYDIYDQLGYTLVTVPKGAVKDRVTFVLEHIAGNTQ
ncbi:MAG TPA: AAA family ATPase [Spirochaetia bacterium]|nr:AAA family ATPase [Spirochaetia bacterium]